MNLLNVIAHHGYAVTSIALFAACCGLPLPLSVVSADGRCCGAWRVAEPGGGDPVRGEFRVAGRYADVPGRTLYRVVAADEYLQVQHES